MALNKWYQPRRTYIAKIIKMTFRNHGKVYSNIFCIETDLTQPNLTAPPYYECAYFIENFV